jgi:hypothetical protein
LNSLNDDDLGVIGRVSHAIRTAAHLPAILPEQAAQPVTRRELLAVRAWSQRATGRQLAFVATDIIHHAANVLIKHDGFDDAVVSRPNLDELVQLLVTLGYPIGRFTLFALLIADVAASTMAEQHEEELAQAVRQAERRAVPWSAWLGRDGDESPAAPTPATEADINGVEQRLAALRAISADLAGRLRDAADRVDDGVRPVWPDAKSTSDFDDTHQSLVATLAGLVDIPSDAGFEHLDASVAKLRADLLRQQKDEEDREHRLSQLRQTIADLTSSLESVPDAAKDHIRQALAATEAELRSLDPGEDVSSHGEAPEQPDPTPSAAEHESTDRVDAPQYSECRPWADGDTPVAVTLVGMARLAEAYWVTVSSDEPEHRAATLRFASAAYTIHNNADATSVLAALDLQTQELHEDAEAAAVATSAMLRAGLVAGWAPSMLNQLRPVLSLPHEWAALIDAATDAIRHGLRIEDGLDRLAPNRGSDDARVELGRRAAKLIEELPRRKNTYQRATHVMQLLLRQNQPLGRALTAVIDWSSGKDKGDRLASALAELDGPDSVDALIENADSATRTPKQSREPIVASARRMLRRSVEEVSAVVHEAYGVQHRLGVSSSNTDVPARTLSSVAGELADAQRPAGMAGAAMRLLLHWLLDPGQTNRSVLSGGAAPTTGTPPMPTEPTTDVLLALPDLPRTPQGTPDRDDPTTRSCLSRLIEPPDIASVVAAYCDRGDLPSARRTVDLAGSGYWPVPDDAPSLQRMRQTIDAAAETWLRRYRTELAKANDLFARVRTQNLLDDSDEAGVSGRLEALSTISDEAYHFARAKLDELASELTARQRTRIDGMRADLDVLDVGRPDRDRILNLLDGGDTVTAAEFLAFIRKGQPLPEDQAPADEDLKAFVALLGRGVADDRRASAQAWADSATNGVGLLPLAASGLTAWDSLRQSAGRGGDRMPGAVRDILRVLGLNATKSPHEISTRQSKWFRQFVVDATPSEKSYVATFGSAAKDYTITVVVEERRGWSVVDLPGADAARRSANLVFSLRHLDLAARRQLAEQSAKTPVQALVVDPAMMGWVSAIAPGSWRVTQRVSLPWTAINPYTPFIAGLVPPEVFVGRDREIAEVTDPYGGLFVYGGRQLGKSALLRRVQATFGDGITHFAVYLDLKGRGIGDAEPAARIWRELAVELQALGIISSRAIEGATADTVVDQARAWLNNNPGRRILFLADEADAFLTADSAPTQTAGGVNHFRNVLRLKELMESTDRRFKVVFAGLHQVQRFGHLSNVPLVHGGPDILVGPLDPPDAQRLVIEPMVALGYEFNQPELVWRLLSATNYQASLIQIFCEELVNTLLRRRGQPMRSPVVVTETDVEAVAASDRVRRRIAERLRITINLEDRYRVLALVIALQSLNDEFGEGYAPEELLQQARDRWPVGFDDMTVAQLDIYLDEMVGLGLLIKLSGQQRYAVRSPNVVNMLGTKADLENELRETAFDLPYVYNPMDARRLLRRADGVEHRSPLTDGQLSAIVTSGANSVVTGTRALGIERVPDAIRDYAEMRGGKILTHKSMSEVKKAMAAAVGTHGTTVVIAVCQGKNAGEVMSAARILAESPDNGNTNRATVLLVDPDSALAIADQTGAEPIRPERWTADSLRSWPECPFDVPEARASLIAATGGWPELVENTIARVMSRGATQAQAIEQVSARADDPSAAAGMVAQVGMTDSLIEGIGSWVDYGLEPVLSADLAEIALEVDLVTVQRLLASLEVRGVLESGDEGVSLERVVYRCLKALRTRP